MGDEFVHEQRCARCAAGGFGRAGRAAGECRAGPCGGIRLAERGAGEDERVSGSCDAGGPWIGVLDLDGEKLRAELVVQPELGGVFKGVGAACLQHARKTVDCGDVGGVRGDDHASKGGDGVALREGELERAGESPAAHALREGVGVVELHETRVEPVGACRGLRVHFGEHDWSAPRCGAWRLLAASQKTQRHWSRRGRVQHRRGAHA